MTRMELTATCSCPVDDGLDVYEVTIVTSRIIPVETVKSVIEIQGNTKQFQELFTSNVARELGVKVITVGWHSGIKTTCEEGIA